MFANARMYSVTPAAAQAWQLLLSDAARRAAVPLEILDHAPPAPLSELWGRSDKGAVFMCGLPYTRSYPRPQLLAAPLPSPPEFGGRPCYWSEFVVGAGSAHRSLADSFGGRIAFTSTESQSGFAAPLRHLRAFAARAPAPLFDTVIAPQINPQGALTAVADGLADLAAIDSYSLHLLRRFNPQLLSRVRTIERTEPRPIPPLVASRALPALATALLCAHEQAPAALMEELSLERFVAPIPAAYDVLGREFAETLAWWREHALAARIHPAFRSILVA